MRLNIPFNIQYTINKGDFLNFLMLKFLRSDLVAFYRTDIKGFSRTFSS